MATFNINNFVIDHIRRGVAFKSNTWDYMWAVNQLKDASLSCTSENSEAKDMLGTTIMTFERAKSCSFSATNAIFDLGLLAAQMGTQKEIASETNTIDTPEFYTLVVEAGKTSYTLPHTPKDAVKEIYTLNGDESIGYAYEAATTADSTHFVYSEGKIVVPTGLAVGTELIVMYEYAATSAVQVVNRATEFPKACRFVLEVLGADTCDPTTVIKAMIVFDNAKLSSQVDIGLATDSGMPVKIDCAQSYCDREKKLFRIVIPHPESDE